MKIKLLFIGLAFSLLVKAQTPQSYTTFQGETSNLYKYEGKKTMLLAKSNSLDATIMKKWTDAMDGAYNFYNQCTGREPDFLPSTYINQKSTIASADPTCGAGCGYLGATGIELLDVYFDQCYTSLKFDNKYEQITFYEMGRNFWFYGNKLAYTNDPITTGYAVFMRFMSMKYLGFDGNPSHVEFVNQIRGLRATYLANTSLNWSNTLGVGQGVPGSSWSAADLFASFCFYLEETYGWQWLQNVWKYAALRPDRVTTQDAVDNFVIASSQAANKNLVSLFQEWRWTVSQSAIDYINSLGLGKPTFYLDYNGITVKCINCVAGDKGKIGDVMYEAVDRDLLIKRRDEGVDLSKVCTSLVTDMTEIFKDATSFNQDISSWDVSNVTDMKFMFSGASAFNQNIGSWNVSNVTNMKSAFNGAAKFNQPIGSWDVRKAVNMNSMFSGASAFNQPIDSWDVSNVTDISSLFAGAKAFNQNISSWDVSKVTDMESVFNGASVFNQPIGSWDVSSVTNMTKMFYGATAFNQDLKSSWCVSNILAEPEYFSTNSALTALNKPVWGHCPQTYVPDDNFEQALIDLGYDSGTLDNYVKTVKIKKITTLDVSKKNIADLKGIEDFSSLSKLECYTNQLTSLDFTHNTELRYIDCQENKLTSLDVSKNTALAILDCQLNQLTSLDVSKNTFLTNLTCGKNPLSNLDVSPNINLTGLDCQDTKLTSLDVSLNPKLRGLLCNYIHNLTSLDLSKNKYLNYLNCENNKLSKLDVSQQGSFLIWLNCGFNSLANIDVSQNTKLEHFYCWNNRLTKLDISQNKALTYLGCENNQLTFESLEPAIGIGNFTYSPQDSIGTAQSVSKTKGESYSYNLNVGGEHNIYQWYKDDVLLSSQTFATLNLPSLKLEDAGVYRCEVTNSVVTGLKLKSRKISLKVNWLTHANGDGIYDTSDKISVYPNPTIDILFIEANTSGEVSIYDLDGKLIMKKQIENAKNEINVSSLTTGSYVLKFLYNNGYKTTKFVKH